MTLDLTNVSPTSSIDPTWAGSILLLHPFLLWSMEIKLLSFYMFTIIDTTTPVLYYKIVDKVPLLCIYGIYLWNKTTDSFSVFRRLRCDRGSTACVRHQWLRYNPVGGDVSFFFISLFILDRHPRVGFFLPSSCDIHTMRCDIHIRSSAHVTLNDNI